MNDLMQLCDDGEQLDKIIVRFRERVKAGQKFEDTLMHLERAANALAGKMNMVMDLTEAVVAGEVNANAT